MALGTRELYLVLRARDEASRVLRGLSGNVDKLGKKQAEVAQRNLRHGQAMASMGIAVGAAGVVGVNALNQMTDAAIEYNEQASRTITQSDALFKKLELIKQIGKDVAKAIPVPFEEVQATLYDIFSSMDVNAAGAAKLARQFAKNAVGGATDIQTAGRAAITVLNAWEMPIKDVTKVSDVFFQLVRKGVGTHEEFAKTIGRSIPSAVRAGQTFEDMAGALAFLTRAGLSTAMASTSLGRAFDALANPRSAKNLKKLGVSVTDAKGNFLPLVDIIDQMRKKTEGMSKGEKSKWLTNAFKGSGGTIQAMRFFNLALNDSDDSLNKHTKAMQNAGGVSEKVYKIMANTPAARLQEFNNRLAIMRTEIGDRLIPVKMRLVEWLIKLLKAWDALSPSMKDMIVKGAAIAAVLAVVLGAVLAVAGVFLMFAAGLTLAGIGIGGLLGPIAIVIGVLVALAAGVYLAVKHWDTLRAKVQQLLPVVIGFAGTVKNVVISALTTLWSWIQKIGAGFWARFGVPLTMAWNQIKNAAIGFWNNIKSILPMLAQIFGDTFSDIGTTLKQVGFILKFLWDNIIKPFGIWFATFFAGIIMMGVHAAVAAFTMLLDVVGPLLKDLFRIVAVIIKGVWEIIKNFVGLVYSIMKGDWKNALNYAWKIVASIFKLILGLFVSAGVLIVRTIKNVIVGVINQFKYLFKVLVGSSIIPDLIRTIFFWWNKLVDLASKAKKFMDDTIAKFKAGWSTITSLFTTKIREVKDKFDGAKTWLKNAGENIVSGLKSGISGAISGIGRWVKDKIVDPIISAVKRYFGIKSPSTVMAGIGGNLTAGLLKGVAGIAPSKWVSRIFGSFPKAIGSFIDKGIVKFKSLPTKAWGAVKGLGGRFAAMVKKAQEARAALGAGGNGGYNGAVGKGSAGIRAIARSYNPSYIAGHRDPQGGPAFDIGSSGGKNNNIANALRANHSKLGLRYVISQMRIASARSGWKWRQYTPITGSGDFRHVNHVHVSYAKGGWINEHVLGVGQRTGRTYQFGEKGREYVSPEGQGGPKVHQEITIYTQEIDPVRHAAELGWKLAAKVT